MDASALDTPNALEALTALAQATRLAVFRQLIVAHPDGLPAGEIARRCEVPHNTMSTHLAVLTRARLVTVEKHGRAMIYRADLDGFRKLLAFLTRDCCSGRSDICAPLLADAVAPSCPPAPEEIAHG